MRLAALLLSATVLAAAGGAQAQSSEDRAAGRAPVDSRCSLGNRSSAACGMLRAGPEAGVRFDGAERQRERRDLYASIDASLVAGDCEGARAKAVDDGRHELAARIRRACKAAS